MRYSQKIAKVFSELGLSALVYKNAINYIEREIVEEAANKCGVKIETIIRIGGDKLRVV